MRKRSLFLCFLLVSVFFFTDIGRVQALTPSEVPIDTGRINHYDTIDYCIKVQDLTLYESQLADLTDDQKNQLALNMVSVQVLRRDPETSSSNWARITEGYSFDLSSVQAEVGTYMAMFYMPALNPGEAELFSFMVNVIADPTFSVSYRFVSETEVPALPAEVTALLPEAEEVPDGTVVEPASFGDVKVEGGTWKFRGWDHSSLTVASAALGFTGTWAFEKDVELPPEPDVNTHSDQGGQAARTTTEAPASAARSAGTITTSRPKTVPAAAAKKAAEPVQVKPEAKPNKTEKTAEDPSARTKDTAAASSAAAKAASSIPAESADPASSGMSTVEGIVLTGDLVSLGVLAVLCVLVLSDCRILIWYKKLKDEQRAKYKDS